MNRETLLRAARARHHLLRFTAASALVLAFSLGLPPSNDAAAQVADISFDDASRIALSLVPGGRVESIERARRRAVIEVEVRDPQGLEHEIHIDASTGRVLSNLIDD